MNKTIVLLLMVTFIAASCNKKAQSGAKYSSEEEAYKAFQAQKNDGRAFGEPINEKGAISYATLMKKMEKSDKVKAKLVGQVSSVCKVKGCWMQVLPANAETPIFVQFKDYGFFMPLDLAGKAGLMEGEAYYAVTTVEELKHFAEDDGKSQAEIDAIKEPLKELKFMANGVMILN